MYCTSYSVCLIDPVQEVLINLLMVNMLIILIFNLIYVLLFMYSNKFVLFNKKHINRHLYEIVIYIYIYIYIL